MNGAKIRLSPEEKELVQNSEWILTKNNVLDKATQLLARLQETYQAALPSPQTSLPEEWITSSPKISRGENYKGLPYRILDYPAVFKKEDIMAMRTLFWWGNFFSITLHLAGSYKKRFEERLAAGVVLLAPHGFYICTGSEQWDHQFSADNYTPLADLTKTALSDYINSTEFIKIAAKADVADWENSTTLLHTQYTLLIKLLTD